MKESQKNNYLENKYKELKHLIEISLDFARAKERYAFYQNINSLNYEVWHFLKEFYKVKNISILEDMFPNYDKEFILKFGLSLPFDEKSTKSSFFKILIADNFNLKKLNSSKLELKAGMDFGRFIRITLDHNLNTLILIGSEQFKKGIGQAAKDLITSDPNSKKTLETMILKQKEGLVYGDKNPLNGLITKDIITTLSHFIDNFKNYQPSTHGVNLKTAKKKDKEKTLEEIWKADQKIYLNVIELLKRENKILDRPFIIETNTGIVWNSFHGDGPWVQALIQSFLDSKRRWIDPKSAPTLKCILKNSFNLDIDDEYLKQGNLNQSKQDYLNYFEKLFKF